MWNVPYSQKRHSGRSAFGLRPQQVKDRSRWSIGDDLACENIIAAFLHQGIEGDQVKLAVRHNDQPRPLPALGNRSEKHGIELLGRLPRRLSRSNLAKILVHEGFDPAPLGQRDDTNIRVTDHQAKGSRFTERILQQ